MKYVTGSVIKKTNQTCQAANGTSIPIIGIATVATTIGDKLVDITGLVSDYIEDPLLGMDFMHKKCNRMGFHEGTSVCRRTSCQTTSSEE